MPDDPVTIKPAHGKKPANITLGELVDALCIYLGQEKGLRVGNIQIDPWDDITASTIFLCDVVDVKNGDLQLGELSFTIEDKRPRSADSKLGSYPRTLIIQKSDNSVIFSLVAAPEHDRSITFHVIKKWENGSAHY